MSKARSLVVDELGAVDGVLAVIARVMVAAGDANRAGPDKGVKLRGFAGELGCGLAGGAVTQRVCLRRKRQGTRIGAPVQVGGRDQDLLPGVDGCLDRQVKPVVDPQVTHRERGVERAPFEAQPGDGGGLAVYGDVETGDRGRLERTARVDEVPAVDGPAGRFGVDFDQLQQGGGQDMHGRVRPLHKERNRTALQL